MGLDLLCEAGGLTPAGPILQGVRRPVSGLSLGATAAHIVEVVAMVALQGTSPQT